MKAGTTKLVELPFAANPQPEVTVAYNDGAVQDVQRIAVTAAAENKSILTFGNAERTDSGRYSVTLSNEFGKATGIVSLNVLGECLNICVKECLSLFILHVRSINNNNNNGNNLFISCSAKAT